MSFDTSWDIDQCKRKFESSDQWQLRRAFLIANKYKYPKDRLVTLAHIFINVECMGCTYPKPTMDLIENLSKDFVDVLRKKLNLNVQKINVTDFNAAESKDYENAQTTTSILKNNQPPNKQMRYTSPYEPNSIIPGFMLKVVNGLDMCSILQHSCSFSKIATPEIKYEHLGLPYVKAELYIQQKLIAVGVGISAKIARMDVSNIAYNILKEMCFTIKVKETDAQPKISFSDIVNDIQFNNDSTIGTSNEDPSCTTDCNKISNNNVGSMILKNMGWKEGDGLGKNNQGITSPIEAVQLKKRAGLGVTSVTNNTDSCVTFDRINLKNFKMEAKKYMMRFIESPKRKLTFTTEFTKDERKIIHSICTNIGLKTRSYGKNANRQITILKNQTPKEIFYELSNSSNLENDLYILELPQHEIFNTIGNY